MAYVRTRTTKAGVVSTTLVEAYRDKAGKPRQRVLANLHGEPTVLNALAKLHCLHEVLTRERDDLVMKYKEGGIDAERFLRDLNKIEAALTAIGKDGAALEEHCSATDDEIEAAIRVHAQKVMDAMNTELGTAFYYHQKRMEAKAVLRRLTR